MLALSLAAAVLSQVDVVPFEVWDQAANGGQGAWSQTAPAGTKPGDRVEVRWASYTGSRTDLFPVDLLAIGNGLVVQPCVSNGATAEKFLGTYAQPDGSAQPALADIEDIGAALRSFVNGVCE